jgi:tetratricopeptide (TPR) repeat protein
MRPNLPLLALALTLALALPAALPAQDPADSAWARGDHAVAEALYRQRLGAHPGDAVALHRLALLTGWAGRHAESVALFDRLLEDRPGDAALALQRVRVLGWARDYPAAIAAVDALLASAPGDTAALRARADLTAWSGDAAGALPWYDRLLAAGGGDDAALARARALLWAGRYAAAGEAFEAVLAGTPAPADALEARRGLARALAFSGRLPPAERAWRRLLATAPDDVEALVGLSQTLRWQGRHAEAADAVARALRLEPGHGDAGVEAAWTRTGAAPRLLPAVDYAGDSEGNRSATTRLAFRWAPAPRLELAADGYSRALSVAGGPVHTAALTTLGALGRATVHLPGGWAATAGAGATRHGDAPRWTPVARAVLATPPGRELTGELRAQRTSFDYTALLARNAILVDELALAFATAPLEPWAARLRVSGARFRGDHTNDRYHAAAAVTRRLAREWRGGVALTTFGFQDRTRGEGYFAPEFFGLAEATLGWTRYRDRWHFLAEAAPGIQRIELDGALQAAYRGQATIGYTLAPGRQLGVTAGYAANALQEWSPTATGYRYFGVGLTGGWTF